MKKNNLILIFVALLFVSLGLVTTAKANPTCGVVNEVNCATGTADPASQTPIPPNTTPDPKSGTPAKIPPTTSSPGSPSPCAVDSTSDQLCNPFGNKFQDSHGNTNVKGIILAVIKYLLGLIGIVAILMIVVAGFRMVAQAGDEKAQATAKKMITNALLGLIIALLAYTIIATVENIIVSGSK